MPGHDLPRAGLIPLAGALVAAVLVALAAARYPGGYDWFGQSMSSLFQPLTLDGAENGARAFAVAGVCLMCLSMAFAFQTIARSGPTRVHAKTIQIAGIGAMVYTALMVTPMHDVLVAFALAFFVVAMVTIFHRLLSQRRFGMLLPGVACLSLTLCNAALYYGQWLDGFLPVVQKISLMAWVAWLLWLSTGDARDQARR